MDSLVEIKKILKNLCVSSQKEMTVGQLAGEYTSQTGKHLNCHAFNCHTLTEFIRSMQDTFRVVKIFRDGREQLIVQLIDRSNVEHVDNMVTSQRSRLPNFLMRRKVNKLPPASATRHAAFSCLSDNQSDPEDNSYLRNSQRDGARSHSAVSPERRARPRQSPPSSRHHSRRSGSRERRRRRSSSDERRSRRRSVSRSQRKYSPSTSSTSSSSRSSRSNSKTRQETKSKATAPNNVATTPHKVISNSLADEIAKQVQVLLQRSREVAEQHRLKKEAENNSARQSLKRAKAQAAESPLKVRGGAGATAGPSASKKVGLLQQHHNVPPPPRLSVQGNLSNAAPCNISFSPEPMAVIDFGVSKNNQHVSTHKSFFGAAKEPPAKTFDSVSVVSQASAGTTFSDYIPAGKSIPGYVKRNILRLLQKFPSGMPASELATKYRVCYGQPLQVKDFGFNSVAEAVASIPESVKITQGTSATSEIHLKSVAPTNNHMPVLQAIVPTAMKQKIEAIIREAYLQGATLDDISVSYKNTHGTDLDYKALGFDSLMSLLSMMDTVRVKMVGTNLMAFLIDSMMPSLPLRVVTKKYLPQGFRMPKPVVELSAECKILAVEISEVYSPQCFYMQFLKSTEKMNSMVDKLQETYQIIEEGMKVAELKTELYVATIHFKEWNRGLVVEILSSTRCKILLVDFGTKVEKDINELCYLVDDPDYKVERFAVLSSLHNVEPPSKLKSWPLQSTKRFSELAFCDNVLAEYAGLSKNDDGAVEVNLAQCVSNEFGVKQSINIRDMLINEDYADVLDAPLRIPDLPSLVELPTAASLPNIPSLPLEPQSVTMQFVNTSIVPANKEKEPSLPRIPTPPLVVSPSPPRAPSPQHNMYEAQTEMPLQILQSISQKLVNIYGEGIVRHAIQRLHQQPFPSANAAAVLDMSNMLWANLQQPPVMMQPQMPMFQPMPTMRPMIAHMPQSPFMQHQPLNYRPPMMPSHQPMMPSHQPMMPNQPLFTHMSNPLMQQQAPRQAPINKKPSVLDLFQNSQQQPQVSQAMRIPLRPQAAPFMNTAPAQNFAPLFNASAEVPQTTANAAAPAAAATITQANARPLIAIESCGIEKKPSVAELLSRKSSISDHTIDDDITIIEDIQEAKHLYKSHVKTLKNEPFVFLSSGEPNHKRWFVLCDDFATVVMQKSSWADILHCIGRTNESMEVHSISTAKLKTFLVTMQGKEQQFQKQINVHIAPVATLLKIKINDKRYPIFPQFKALVSQLDNP